MDITTSDKLSIGDIVQGPDGPEQITEINLEGRILHFLNEDHCMTFRPGQQITRLVSSGVLREAGIQI